LGPSEESSLTQSTPAQASDIAQANCFKEVLPLELWRELAGQEISVAQGVEPNISIANLGEVAAAFHEEQICRLLGQ